MSMKYVRDYYGVPAKRGGIVEVYNDDGSMRVRGTITSATQYIVIEGRNYHPTWNVVYYDSKGTTVLKDTRTPKGLK